MINNVVPKAMNIIIYDEDNIKYYDGVLTSISVEPLVESYCGINGGHDVYIKSHHICIDTPSLNEHDNIKLDDTMMKRIAKFNKEEECKRLDALIEEKKEHIKELDNLLMDKEKRWNKVKDYIKNIYEIDPDDEWDDDYD